MRARTREMKALAREAVAQEGLHRNLADFSRRFRGMRREGMAHLENPAQAREKARTMKDACLDHLPALVQRLEERISANGGRVHWAASAQEAQDIVLAIARAHDVKSVVKGKSMMSEEVGINPVLEEAGIQVWETDLGEYIVQLAGEAPSHILAPAIHLNRAEIGELFTRKLGVDFTRDPQALTLTARRRLREKFFAAEMGITGGNFAIAESGTLALFENEGNIRYSTSLPKVHVALIGIEKVIATWEQFDHLRNMLVYSATGQKAPVYLSLISGPARPGEWDGPQEFHLILLDNGRSRILGEPLLRQSLRCLRCAACLNVCPVYEQIGGHAYGWVYSGPIGIIFNSNYLPSGEAADLPHACTLCGACAEVCPVMIEHPDLMLHLRWLLAEDPDWLQGGTPKGGAFLNLYAHLARRPQAWRAAWCALRAMQPLAKGPLLPHRLATWAKTRGLPGLKRPFSSRWPELRRRLGQGDSS